MDSVRLFLKNRFGGIVALQAGRLFLWLPVALGAGAAVYLFLPFEPATGWVMIPALVGAGALFAARRLAVSGILLNILILLVVCLAGMAVCKLRTEHVRAPVLSSEVSNVTLQAFVIDVVSPSEDQPRLLLAPIAIRGVRPEATPLRLRVSLRPSMIEASGVKPGDAISMFALVNPPPPPNMPGGYDFARTAWYQGIGGVGLVPGAPRIIASPPHSWRLGLIMRLNRLRWSLTERLVQTTAPEWPDGRTIGGFAAALVTGHEQFIPQSLIDDMRDSGLAHILSISGVHMAIVGGFVFFALRGLMACVPWLALHVPIKKWAAALSIVCILLYLALSGAPAPAVRSAVVACVAFGAILLDRRALSLRALAIAAIVVICLTPEAVIQPGFQMSFSATAALLALAEGLKKPVAEISVPIWVKAIQSAFRGLWLSLLASVVATAATTPFAIAYFNRFSVYGLLSNLFEAPVTAFVVMPALAVGTVFSATPLGGMALRIAGMGLWVIEHIAALTADLPRAVINWPSAPAYVLPISFLGLIWTCLMRGRIRWLGIAAATTILWWPRVAPPDIWIDAEGGNAAIRKGAATYVLRPKVRQYGFTQWHQHYGLEVLEEAARDTDFACKGYECAPLPQGAFRVAFWFGRKPPKVDRLVDLCRASDLVVLRSPVGDWPEECVGINHISADDFRDMGAMELTRTQKGWTIKAAQPLRGKRYWTEPSEAEGDRPF